MAYCMVYVYVSSSRILYSVIETRLARSFWLIWEQNHVQHFVQANKIGKQHRQKKNILFSYCHSNFLIYFNFSQFTAICMYCTHTNIFIDEFSCYLPNLFNEIIEKKKSDVAHRNWIECHLATNDLICIFRFLLFWRLADVVAALPFAVSIIIYFSLCLSM